MSVAHWVLWKAFVGPPETTTLAGVASVVREIVKLRTWGLAQPLHLIRSPCGSCDQQRRLATVRAEVTPDIRLDNIRLIGDKALRLVFTDGHGRGI